MLRALIAATLVLASLIPVVPSQSMDPRPVAAITWVAYRIRTPGGCPLAVAYPALDSRSWTFTHGDE